MEKTIFNEIKYKEDAKRYKELFYSCSTTANQVLSFLMMMTFHEIGEDIQKKGMLVEEYIKRIPSEFPNHKTIMSKQNIRNMCKFSLLIEVEEITTLRLFEYNWSELIPYIESSNNHDEFIAHIEAERKAGKA